MGRDAGCADARGIPGVPQRSIIKYSMRAGRKDGSDDAGKAQHYAQKLAEIDAQEGRKHG
jgi:hypothetical protein